MAKEKENQGNGDHGSNMEKCNEGRRQRMEHETEKGAKGNEERVIGEEVIHEVEKTREGKGQSTETEQRKTKTQQGKGNKRRRLQNGQII